MCPRGLLRLRQSLLAPAAVGLLLRDGTFSPLTLGTRWRCTWPPASESLLSLTWLDRRSGAASAAANAGVQWELWGQHGDWKSKDAQAAYMKRDAASVLSVSRAAMTPVPPVAPLTPEFLVAPPPSPTPLLLTAASHPPEDPDDEELLVEGIPPGSFAWHSPPA